MCAGEGEGGAPLTPRLSHCAKLPQARGKGVRQGEGASIDRLGKGWGACARGGLGVELNWDDT
eukprot:10032655-Alexandrium_andersonii.AAC.1